MIKLILEPSSKGEMDCFDLVLALLRDRICPVEVQHSYNRRTQHAHTQLRSNTPVVGAKHTAWV